MNTDRERTGDPRPALIERYGGFDEYARQFRIAVEALVARRCLLAEEVGPLTQAIERLRPAFE